MACGLRRPRGVLTGEAGLANAKDGVEREALSLAFVARAVLVVLGLLALARALWLGRDVLFVAFFAVLVAMFLSLFVEPLVRRGLRRGIAVPLVLLTIVLLFAGTARLSWPVLREQGLLVQQQVPQIIDRVESLIARQADALGGEVAEQADAKPQLRERARSEVRSLISGALPLLNTALGFITGIALVIAAGAFLAVEPKQYVRGLVRLVPRSHRPRTREVLPLAGTALRQWIKGTAIGMLTIAVLTTVGLTVIGVPAALALGLLAGLLEFVPYVGPAASFIPAVAMAIAISPQKAVAVVVLYSFIQFVESFLLMPLLMRGMVKLPPALTILFQSFMAALFGFLGLLLAVPVLAFGKVLVTELWVEAVADEA